MRPKNPSCKKCNTLGRQNEVKGLSTTLKSKKCPTMIMGGEVAPILRDQLGQFWIKYMLLLESSGQAKKNAGTK